MESTGVPNKVQISQEMAERLTTAGKEHWCIPREDKVSAKGKGLLSTYWLEAGGGADAQTNLTSEDTSDMSAGTDLSLDDFEMRSCVELIENRNRIVDWTVEVLAYLLKEIAARRKATNVISDSWSKVGETIKHAKKKNATVIDEVEEIIMLPEFNEEVARRGGEIDASEVMLSQDVFDKLRDYIRTIASLYNDNRKYSSAWNDTFSIICLWYTDHFSFSLEIFQLSTTLPMPIT
jgi:hypothetical protein